MKRNDWIGLASSIGLHLLMLALFSLLSVGAAEQQQLGYVEVEFGEWAEGRPVEESAEEAVEEAPREPEPQPEPEPTETPAETAEPVDLPEEPVVADEKLPEPEEDPEAAPTPSIPEEAPTSPTGGDAEGEGEARQGQEGPGEEEARTSPFQIEGLNREPRYTPNPAYTEQVNATLKFRITVDPEGRVVAVIPLQKASPGLERSVKQELLQRWRFNTLPANAPQQNQTGTITFRFRLE